jgi:hypothetical protein
VIFGFSTEVNRFESVTDRFRVEFGPLAAGQVPKDSDLKYEYLVKGLQYVQVKVSNSYIMSTFIGTEFVARSGLLRASKREQNF